MLKIEQYIKATIFGVILIILFIPVIQQNFNLLNVKPLKGAIEVIPDSSFTTESWLNENFQKQKESYLNQQFGFRNLLVRLNNEIAFRLFKTAKANGVIIGKENYLYEENYIKAYFGTDYIGQEKIQTQTFKLERLQDTLQKLNKNIFVVFAPGKGTYLPEFIPDKFLNQKKTITNYESYLAEFERKNITCLDFNKWFVEMKSSTRYPLYGKCGIHWSKYGEFIAGDSLISYIGHLRKINIPKLILDSVVIKSSNEQGDYDIGEGMNLLFDLNTYPMGYPYFHIKKDSSTQEPKVLFVADSYYWGMFSYGFSRDIFNKGQFWFYNQQIYPESFDHPLNVPDINIREEVEKNDVVVLLSTDANLYKFPFGFIDQLYDEYFNKGKAAKQSPDKEKRIEYYINGIKQNPEWLNKIAQQAKKENISLQDAIKKNAEYMVWKENNPNEK